MLRRLWAAQVRWPARRAHLTTPTVRDAPTGGHGSGPDHPSAHGGDRVPGSERGAALSALLAAAPTSQHRTLLVAAAGAGASTRTLAAFADRIAAMDRRQLARSLDPLAQPRGLLCQQSATTCGSAALVVARMLVDPVYALRVLDGHDAATGHRAGGDVRHRFAVQEQAVKRRTNGVRGAHGPGVPWPRALGTPPWGACREMNGPAGRPGTRYRVMPVDSDSVEDRTRAFRVVAAAAADGLAVPLYVGDDALPRHVVLVVGAGRAGDVGALRVYDPARGATGWVAETAFRDGRLAVGGWERLWAAVVPS